MSADGASFGSKMMTLGHRRSGPPRLPVLAKALALAALARGECVILFDEDQGTSDLIAAAELVTASTIAFMAVHGRGLTTLALPASRVDTLRLAPMSRGWGLAASSTVSIEAREGVTTGISAADRARTIRVAVDPAATAVDLVSPGHVFPLRIDPDRGGRRERGALALALARDAGYGRGVVLSEILDDTGERAGEAHLETLAARWSITRVTFSQSTT